MVLTYEDILNRRGYGAIIPRWRRAEIYREQMNQPTPKQHCQGYNPEMAALPKELNKALKPDKFFF